MVEPDSSTKSWQKYTPCGCVLLMFVVGIALPVIGWMIWSAKAARMVEDELAKIRDAGEPIEPSDLASLYKIPSGQDDTTRWWVSAIDTFESQAFNEVAQEFPIVGQGTEIPPVGESWEQLEAVEAFLADYQDEMDSVHQATSLGGYARFDRNFDEGISMLLPNIQGIRGAARMLSLEARVAAHRGDSHAVAQALHSMFATSNAAAEDPILISQLVRIAIAGMAASELQSAIETVEFSEDDLAMLRKDLQAMDLQRGLDRSLMGERVIGIVTFRNPGRFSDMGEMPLPVRANNEDLALYLRTMSQWIEASRQPFPEALNISESTQVEIQELADGSGINKMRYIFTSMLLPAIDAAVQAVGRGIGTNTSADTALAIEQYRKANGELPGSLDELVPDYITSVPIDPMDGQPLRYIINDEGYALYSVGRNRVDDGGVMGDERLDEVFSIRIDTAKPEVQPD